MGYDLTRFEAGSVDEELICPICSAVFQDPVQASPCEHAFCKLCIQQWITQQQQQNCPVCPVCRGNSLSDSNLRSVPRILRNLLARLNIQCDNKPYGCNAVLKLELLSNHVNDCEFNPKKPLPCEKGCGLIIPKDELKNHNCIKELRNLLDNQQQKIMELKCEVTEQNRTVSDLIRELTLFKDFMRAMRVTNPTMRAIADQMERDEVIRWSNSLVRARVTRWGGMISTPDDSLQLMIKRALSECGCPPHILEDLMENCHERRWPRGLNSLETRQNNRRVYDAYVCRRIPGKCRADHRIILHINFFFFLN